MVPVGVPGEPDVTTAVNVTSSPTTDGLSDELTFVVVGAAGATTFCVTGNEVLASELEHEDAGQPNGYLMSWWLDR